MSNHAIDSINLKDPRFGITEQINDLLATYEVRKGKIILSLEPGEQHAGLTVNEYETLLMKHDLAEVLRNPLWFMAQKATHMLRDPKAIRSKAKNYMKYDLVQLVNEVIDALGLNESLVERVIDRIAAASASRRLRMKRPLTLLVNSPGKEGPGESAEHESRGVTGRHDQAGVGQRGEEGGGCEVPARRQHIGQVEDRGDGGPEHESQLHRCGEPASL